MQAEVKPVVKPAENPTPDQSQDKNDDTIVLGVKNNPFLSKQKLELPPKLPQGSPKPPPSDTKISEKFKDNPFLKAK